MSFVIDADSKLDYGCDWAAWLGASDTIAQSTWTISPQTLAVPALTNASFDDTTTTVWVDDAVDEANYQLTNHVVTAEGRTHDQTIHLRCRAR